MSDNYNPYSLKSQITLRRSFACGGSPARMRKVIIGDSNAAVSLLSLATYDKTEVTFLSTMTNIVGYQINKFIWNGVWNTDLKLVWKHSLEMVSDMF